MAFVGVFATLSSEHNGYHSMNVALISLLSAVSAAAYFGLSSMIRNCIGGRSVFIFIPLLFGAIISIVFFPMFYSFSNFTFESFLYGFFLGFLSLAVSNNLWTYVTSESESKAFSSMAFFIPVLSTLALVYQGNGIVSNEVLNGLMLVVLSNVLIHFNNNLINTWKICTILIVTMTVIAIISAPISIMKSPHIFTSSSTIFALLSAFLLNRVWQKKQNEEKSLSNVANHLKKYINNTNSNLSDVNNLNSHFFEFCKSLTENINKNYIALITAIDYFKVGNNATHYDDLIAGVNEFYYLRKHSVTMSEILMLFFLCLVTNLQLFFHRDDDFLGDLTFIIFSASTFFIVYIIHEYDFRPVDFKNIKISKENIECKGNSELPDNSKAPRLIVNSLLISSLVIVFISLGLNRGIV